jgi:methylated-DNA-[protein]-cysteine S-methyltransferase
MKKSFYDKVYNLAAKIPKGKVTTYKALAHSINSKAYRAVGTAMNKNPWGFGEGGGHSSLKKKKQLVPCHRVINSNGSVGGFASGTKKKIQLLRNEGIKIINGKIDLKKYMWN